jgi:hypothetical protein
MDRGLVGRGDDKRQLGGARQASHGHVWLIYSAGVMTTRNSCECDTLPNRGGGQMDMPGNDLTDIWMHLQGSDKWAGLLNANVIGLDMQYIGIVVQHHDDWPIGRFGQAFR